MTFPLFRSVRDKIVSKIYKAFVNVHESRYKKFKAEVYNYGYVCLELQPEDLEKLKFKEFFYVSGYNKYPVRNIVLVYEYKVERENGNEDVKMNLDLAYRREQVSYLDFLTSYLAAFPEQIDEVCERLYELIRDAINRSEEIEKQIATKWKTGKIGSTITICKFL